MRAHLRAGQRVAIVGIGFIGALLVQLGAQAGAEVVALTRRAYARDVALACGARMSVATDDMQAAIAAVMDSSDGEGCPRVIEAAGEPLPAAKAEAGEPAEPVRGAAAAPMAARR